MIIFQWLSHIIAFIISTNICVIDKKDVLIVNNPWTYCLYSNIWICLDILLPYKSMPKFIRNSKKVDYYSEDIK